MNQLKLINPHNIPENETRGYSLREAARAVVLDQDNNVALMHVAAHGYYKLPGGGIDEGENNMQALNRECLEEIGCVVEVIDEIGLTVEYWHEQKEKQISYCYMARVIGEKGKPDFTESEKKRGFAVIWIPYEKALQTIKESKPTNYEADYIVPRDTLFLEAAQEYLKK